MILALDIGNTRAKAGLFHRGELLETFRELKSSDIPKLASEHSVSGIIACSVSQNTDKWLKNIDVSYQIILDYQTKVPVKNSYKTPETLGMDRLAAVIGGTVLFPNHDILSIDAGTCITVDFLKNNCYEGGYISPGIQIKFKALNTFTENLPLIESEAQPELIGKDTRNSILSGVINGTVAEINHTIDRFKGISNNLAVILCGGDSSLLGKQLKNVDLIEEKLVLIGLNEIFEYNKKER